MQRITGATAAKARLASGIATGNDTGPNHAGVDLDLDRRHGGNGRGNDGVLRKGNGAPVTQQGGNDFGNRSFVEGPAHPIPLLPAVRAVGP